MGYSSMEAFFCLYLFTAENAETAEMTEKEKLDQITERIIGAAIEVWWGLPHHKKIGGLKPTLHSAGSAVK